MNKIDINEVGKYNLGLTKNEVKEYLRLRSGNKDVSSTYKKFKKTLGQYFLECKLSGGELDFMQSLMVEADYKSFVRGNLDFFKMRTIVNHVLGNEKEKVNFVKIIIEKIIADLAAKNQI